MRPRLAVHYQADTSLRGSVRLSERALRFAVSVPFAYFQHLHSAKFGVPGVFSPASDVSSARHFLTHIVELCSNLKVVRRSARRVVALMKNKKPVRDGAVKVGPCKAVGAGSIKNPIPVFVSRADPVPAPVCVGTDKRSKANKRRYGAIDHKSISMWNIGAGQ